MNRSEVVHAPRYDIDLNWKNTTNQNDQVLSCENCGVSRRKAHIVPTLTATKFPDCDIEYYPPRGQAVSTSRIEHYSPRGQAVSTSHFLDDVGGDLRQQT